MDEEMEIVNEVLLDRRKTANSITKDAELNPYQTDRSTINRIFVKAQLTRNKTAYKV